MKIFELDIPNLKYSSFIEALQDFLMQTDLEKKRGKTIFTPNPEICLKTLEDKEFLEILQQADSLTSDGIGLYLAYQIIDLKDKLSLYIKNILLQKICIITLLPYFLFNIIFRKRYLSKKYGDRICGSDITTELVRFSEKNNIKIAIIDPYYPLDTKKCESQKHFSENLRKVFRELDFEFYIWKEDEQNIIKILQNSKVKICFLTLGMKKQELLALELQKKCPNIRLFLGVGSSFDYYTGFQKRAPKLWRDLGFEWLYRIFTSPKKLARLKRIFQALIVFPVKVIMYKK